MESGHGMIDHPGSYQASRRRRMPVPALPPYLIEPIWHQLEALLPEREVSHPLGCHRRRIADETCSATTLRDRRDEWIELGVMDGLREMVLEAYDRFIGLEVGEMAID